MAGTIPHEDVATSLIKRRKLRPLVITMGSTRQEYIEKLFEHPDMARHFEPPEFSEGIPQRLLRNRIEFLTIANEVGLLPEDEWRAISKAQDEPEYMLHTNKFWECLHDVPVTTEGRKGSQWDLELHYSEELWKKARCVNRGRAVLACTFAHLRAMKRCVEEGYDFILEDNVRAPPSECAERIWAAMEASKEWEQENNKKQCHLRYYGWLGSIPNIKWVLHNHSTRSMYVRKSLVLQEDSLATVAAATVFPFPVKEDFDIDATTESDKNSEEVGGKTILKGPSKGPHDKPGGTAIWGAYAYWISATGFESLISSLRTDVGALLWKGKRMRCHVVKPVDKVMPRLIIAALGREAVHVTTQPCFFRAPMLTSKIHTKWDAEFCKSTEYQLSHTGLDWSDLWTCGNEIKVVAHYKKEGTWLTPAEVTELEEKGTEEDEMRSRLEEVTITID